MRNRPFGAPLRFLRWGLEFQNAITFQISINKTKIIIYKQLFYFRRFVSIQTIAAELFITIRHYKNSYLSGFFNNKIINQVIKGFLDVLSASMVNIVFLGSCWDVLVNIKREKLLSALATVTRIILYAIELHIEASGKGFRS